MSCYGCSTLLTNPNLRLCDTCRVEHAKLEEPYLSGYIDWECKFVLSRKGRGHKMPDGDWFRWFTKSGGKWREV